MAGRGSRQKKFAKRFGPEDCPCDTHIRRDDWQSARHCLDYHITEPLIPRREEHEVSGGIQLRHVFMVHLFDHPDIVKLRNRFSVAARTQNYNPIDVRRLCDNTLKDITALE